MADAAATLADFTASFDGAGRGEASAAAMLDLIDTLGCAAAGRQAEGVAEIRGVIDSWGRGGEATLWFGGRSAAGPDAALYNGTLSHAVEFDDTHDTATLHAGVAVIPAVLAAAERRGAISGAELISAIIVGVEVTSRLGLAADRGPGETGWLFTPLCGTFGAAAGAARALGLDAARTVDALGLAYSQAAGNGQATIDSGLAKRMQPGFAARAGLTAAILAKAGLTGSKDVFEGTRGYFPVYHGGGYRRAPLVEGLGKILEVENLSYKPHPVCRWTHAALQAAIALREAGLRPEQVSRIDVAVNRQAYMSTGQPLALKQAPANIVGAQFSIPYAVAVALTEGEVRLEHFTRTAIRRPDFLALASKVGVEVSESWPAALSRSISPARVRVTLADGTVRENEVLVPKGDGRDPGTPELLRGKFVDCCEFGGMSRAAGERLLAQIDTLPGLADAVPLLRALASAPMNETAVA